MQGLIIDDDPLICQLVNHFCGKIEDISSTTLSNSGFEALSLINKYEYDLIFLDYNLPDLNGEQLLGIIPHHTPVIMITSNKEFASESYNYEHIIDYLVKPIHFDRFQKSIQKVKKYLATYSATNNLLFVKEGNKLVKIVLEDVLFFKSEANYVSIVSGTKKIMTLMTVKELETKLPEYFQRVHRSFIVNLNKILSIEKNQLSIDKTKIPISHSYEKVLMEKIKLLN